MPHVAGHTDPNYRDFTQPLGGSGGEGPWPAVGRFFQRITRTGGEPAPVVTPGGLTQQEIRQRGSSYAANQKEMEAAQRSIQSA